MKALLILVSLISISAFAADRLPPDAPADYQAKKNPAEGKKDLIAKGKKLYEKKCQNCHGEKGDGQGKGAKDLNPPVPAFNKPGYLASRKDGQLYWIIEKGSTNTDMEAYGPGTSYNFKEEDIWNLVAYIKSKFGK